jgi:hypothetical protein
MILETLNLLDILDKIRVYKKVKDPKLLTSIISRLMAYIIYFILWSGVLVYAFCKMDFCWCILILFSGVPGCFLYLAKDKLF